MLRCVIYIEPAIHYHLGFFRNLIWLNATILADMKWLYALSALLIKMQNGTITLDGSL